MEYGRIVKRAVQITWRYKVLWVFGIAAALFGGGDGGGGSRGPSGQGIQYTFGSSDFERWWRSFELGAEALIPVILGILAILGIVALVMFIVGIIVRYTSLGALAGMVDEVERTEGTSLKSGLNIGWARMLRLFAIDLLITIGIFVAVLVFIALMVIGVLIAVMPAVALFQTGSALRVLGIVWGVGVGLALLLLLIVIGLAIAAIATLIREFSFRACVLDTKGVFDALRAGIALTRSRFREAALMWLLLLGINLVLGLAAVPLALVGVAGLVGPAFLVGQATQSPLAAVGVALPLLFLLILVSVFVGGILLTFHSAVWTLTYRELRGGQLKLQAA